jgi:hypothetical protein
MHACNADECATDALRQRLRQRSRRKLCAEINSRAQSLEKRQSFFPYTGIGGGLSAAKPR